MTPSVLVELIQTFFTGQTMTRAKIVEVCERYHEDNGGVPGSGISAVKKALQTMQAIGAAEPTGVPGYWRIVEPPEDQPPLVPLQPLADGLLFEDAEETVTTYPPEVEHGSGAAAVYAYSFPAYIQLAEVTGSAAFPVKIGMTTRDVAGRIAAQVATGLPEQPVILLVVRTDHPRRLERIMHDVLTNRGQHLTTAPGSEWFLTSPAEVRSIYDWSSPSPGTVPVNVPQECDE